jgi:hypothetical protein
MRWKPQFAGSSNRVCGNTASAAQHHVCATMFDLRANTLTNYPNTALFLVLTSTLPHSGIFKQIKHLRIDPSQVSVYIWFITHCTIYKFPLCWFKIQQPTNNKTGFNSTVSFLLSSRHETFQYLRAANRPTRTLKADSHIACRAHAVPLPCLAAKGLECVFPIWFTQCGRVWFTLAMSRPCHALIKPFFSRPRHSTAVERRPMGYLLAFGFFRLPRGVPRRLLSEPYQSSSQRSITTTAQCGISTLQKRRSVKLSD